MDQAPQGLLAGACLAQDEHRPVRALGPHQIEYALDVLQVHGDAFQAIGDFTGDRAAFQAADLLEIGELGDFHAVQPDLPAQSPRAQRG